MDAALRVLHTHGYSGATIVAIRDAAGVSTGALNHQFPTKAMLMAAVVSRFCEEQIAAYKRALSGAATPRAAMEAILDTSGTIIRRPEMAATFEIHLARRNDPELDRLTKPTYERFERRLRLWVRKVRRAAGIEDQARFDHFRLLSGAVYRGLAMELIGKSDDHDVDGTLKLWRKAAIQIIFDEDHDGL